ncbi:CRTAC1 family protein, partial [candidate division KSB1 bacterium]
DLFNANMDGDANGFYRNDRTHFTDIAEALGVDSGGRQLGSPDNGSVRPSLVDYDNDGFIDIYMANYGPNTLYRNQNGSSFGDVGAETGLAIDSRYDTGTWGDFDNDGYQDLYVNGTITGGVSYRDYLFHNDRGTFTDVTPENILLQEADHGAHWVDFDRDGDLDLSLTGAAETGMHHLFRNMLPENRRTSSIQVMVLDENGHATRAGSEVRLFSADNRTLLGAGILDTGSGYNSQNVMPVHIGLGDADMINIEITIMTGGTRKSTEFTDIDPNSYAGRVFTVRIDPEGRAIR